MVAFDSARRGLACAVGIQRAMTAYNEQHVAEPLRVRIGLHVGDVVKEGADFFGRNVVLASRVAGQARGGEILVSSVLRQLAEGASDVAFGEPRELELKGLKGTHTVYAVRLDGCR
jgi:class 3 adenylate cyclase